MSCIRIIGIGSPSGDDQVGWRVIEALERLPTIRQSEHTIEVIALDRPGVQLLHYLEDVEGVILIDAMRSDQTVGTIMRLENDALLQQDFLLSSHGLGVASALKLAHALGALPRKLVLYGVEIAQITASCGLSAWVAGAVNEVVRRIETELLQV